MELTVASSWTQQLETNGQWKVPKKVVLLHGDFAKFIVILVPTLGFSLKLRPVHESPQLGEQ